MGEGANKQNTTGIVLLSAAGEIHKVDTIGHQNTLPQENTKEYDWMQVQRILNGEDDCWDLLYNAAYNAVLRCVVRADHKKRFEYYEYRDIVDEAFYLCYAQLERYRGWSKFSGWVSGYAKNITRNRCTRESTRRKHAYSQREKSIRQMESNDPESILIRQERNACLWKAFFEMNSMDQAILSGRILEGKSFAAIGRELHLSRKETLQRYGVAVNCLRKAFARYYCGCIEEEETVK